MLLFFSPMFVTKKSTTEPPALDTPLVPVHTWF